MPREAVFASHCFGRRKSRHPSPLRLQDMHGRCNTTRIIGMENDQQMQAKRAQSSRSFRGSDAKNMACADNNTRQQGPETQQRVETADFIVVDFLQRGAPVAAWRPVLDARNRRALLNATVGKEPRGRHGRPVPSGHYNNLARALVSLYCGGRTHSALTVGGHTPPGAVNTLPAGARGVGVKGW